MTWKDFIVVAENIHCTRIVKRGGIWSAALPGGGEAVRFVYKDAERLLPIPVGWEQRSPAFADGKIKHIALAIYQAMHGSSEDQTAGEDYLCYQAERQIAGAATYLDLNVDEYSTDMTESAEAMAFAAGLLSNRYDTPLAIDSSSPDLLRIGLEKCRKDIQPPLLNSISLERVEAADLAKHFNADAIVNAAGRESLPADAEQKIVNLRELVAMLDDTGIPREKMHLDPLVLPVSTDPMNAKHFLDATSQAAAEFDGVHLSGGLSNVSFGMPKRKLLNMTFMHLCAEAGTDGGIIDPAATPLPAVSQLDHESEPVKLAKAVLTGEDMFGMEFITAYREGRLK